MPGDLLHKTEESTGPWLHLKTIFEINHTYTEYVKDSYELDFD